MKDRLINVVKIGIGIAVVSSGLSLSDLANAACVWQGSTASNPWSRAESNPIGPSSLQILAQRFQPVGTVFFDQIFPMNVLLGSSPNAVLIKCETEADANAAGSALRLDDTYQLGGGFLYNGVQYYYTAYQAVSTMYSPVGWKLYGVLPDGTQRELIRNDSADPSNTAVRFPVTHRSCAANGTTTDCAAYPYVITAADFPSVRLVLIRSPYDDFTALTSDRRIGRIGFIVPPSAASSDSDYGYITLNSEFRQYSAPACGITQVPQTVDLGTHSISTVAAGATPWSPFSVTYECSLKAPVNSLRIGFEPQNRANLLPTDYHYLKPDTTGANANGVGVVYRRGGESSKRYWVQNSGCQGISTDTVNNSNCWLAGSQTQDQGWYPVMPDSSTEIYVSPGYQQYTEPFEARMEQLPGTASTDIAAGKVSATVNVLVNQP
jgi:type 1 fimbria pilin